MISKRSAAALIVRQFHSVRPGFKGRAPGGCLLAPLLKSPDIAFSHPQDDEENYLKFLRNDLPKFCLQGVPKENGTADKVVQMLNYNVPNFHSCWTFGIELIYRSVAPKEQQTDEGFLKTRLLRACMELKHAGAGVCDDIMDGSPSRRGKPSWMMAAPKLMPDALCGGLMMHHLPYHILKNHFRDHPFYTQLLETVIRIDFGVIVGCIMDVEGQGASKDKLIDAALHINEYKAGSYFSMQATLGVLNAGIGDPVLLKKVETYFSLVGEMFQCWDDFCDYYCEPEQTGKPECDFINGGTTWASATAQSSFNEKQKKVFEECYGSSDPEKIETVKTLYDSVDLPGKYVHYIKQRYNDCKKVINDFNHSELEIACINHLVWLVGMA